MPFGWPSGMSGLPFIGRGLWPRWGAACAGFAREFSSEWGGVNLFGHSHGGQICIEAAVFLWRVYGIRVRTMTTYSTPRRKDVPGEKAAETVGYWQHLHDTKIDWTATLRKKLGQVGDGDISIERRFLIPGVANYGVPGIGHSDALNRPELFHHWDPILDGIVEG
jgi:hypothetical protein